MNEGSWADPDHHLDEQGSKAMLSLNAGFVFVSHAEVAQEVSLKWSTLFLLDVKAGATKKHQPHKRFPTLVTVQHHLCCAVRHPPRD